MKNKIYILSQPVQSGKTSLLMRWLDHRQRVGGILTPDVGGKRKLYDIESNRYFDLQQNEGDEGIRIGRFVFNKEVFGLAQRIIKASADAGNEWIVIDEIGRLEMDRNEGLEPAVSEIIEHFKTTATPTRLLLVIRDYLLNEAITHYDLKDATVLNRAFFGQPDELSGVVLCGGKSVRMGSDKAFITYHHHPQYMHVAETMKPFCKEVYISCREEQKTKISQQYEAITDSATFKDAGPATGVLSAFERLPHTPLLVVGCDYPHFTAADMLALLQAREPGTDAVCYKNNESGFEEPLLAIYEKTCAPLLLGFYRSGQHSLRHFLKTVRTKTIVGSTKNITGIDTPS